MIRPTGRLLALALAGVVPATLPILLGDAWVLAWLVWLLALVLATAVDFALTTSLRRLHLELQAPPAVHLSRPAVLRLQLRATAPVRLHCRIEVDGDCEPLPLAVLAGAPGAETTAELPLQPRRRGRLEVVRLHVRWSGPLRLCWREHRLPSRHTVLVLPDLPTAHQRAMRLLTSREFQLGLRIERYVGDGTEFESLREFVPGMDRRAIDWKASARHRMVLCRQFRAERNHQVVLCVDAGRLMGEPLDGVPRLDHAIVAALQLAHVSLRTGDLVGMYAFAAHGLLTVPPLRGIGALAGLQDRLCAIDYSPAETNFTRSLTELLQQLRRRTLVVLFTEFVDSIAAELMVPAIARLARRHVVLFVTLRDPLPGLLARAAPRDREALHRAVVAAELQRDRDVVLERIRACGAFVIDAEHGELGPALVDRYLQVKRRELV